MSSPTSDTLLRRYCGFFLLLCMVIGGGTRAGLASDFLLQLAALPLLGVALFAGAGRYRRGVAIFVLAVIGVQFIQFAPWPGSDGVTLVTRDIGRSVDLLVFTAVLAGFFLALGSLSDRSLVGLIPFLLVGVMINVAVAFFQFSANNPVIPGLLPYEASAGAFANANHFSSLLFMCLPVLVAWLAAQRRMPIALGIMVVVVFVEFVARSAAGMLLSLAAAAVTLWVVRDGRQDARLRWYLLPVTALGLLLLAFNVEAVLRSEIVPEVGDRPERLAFAVNTLKAIAANLPFGSGFGSFQLVYPQFEPVGELEAAFVNHAHNDYLELLLEGGLPALALLLAYGALLVAGYRDARRSKLKMTALCGIGFVMLHSLFDYPLRTMGVAGVFAYLNALYFAPVASRLAATAAAQGSHYLSRRAPRVATGEAR